MNMSTPPTPTPPTSSPPADLIAGNNDLLTEILSYLPVKPLLRFKSVNKQFLSLISTPHFSLLHSIRHHLRPSSALFFLHRSPGSWGDPDVTVLPLSPNNSQNISRDPDVTALPFPPRLPTPYNNNNNPDVTVLPLRLPRRQSTPPFLTLLKSHHPIDILQSCNGLLLCSSGRVLNPTTHQIDSVFAPRRLVLGFSLVFDPSRSNYYQLVCVWQVDENAYAIDVYTSKTRQWRPVVSHFTAPFDVEFERGVYCDGRVYWLSHTDSTVVFDVERECVETLVLPSAIEGAYIERFRYFGESCGHLHLVEIRTNCVPDFEILELDRRRGGGEKMGWFVKYKVNLDVVGRGFESEMFQDHSDRFGRRFRFYAFSILAVIHRNGNEDDGSGGGDSELVVSVPGKVISYNLRTKVSRLICDVVDESDKWLPFKGYNAYQYIESLYCL